MRNLFFGIICAVSTALTTVSPSPATAQSRAAMQVCADILAQYGIAPEGCDPQDDVYKKPDKKTEPIPASQSTSNLSSTQQELNENNVFFRKGGDRLDAQAIQKLDTLGKVLNTSVLNTACIRLVGHSDASGPSNINTEMGIKRANVVAQYLRQRVQDSARIQEVKSAGEDELIQGLAPEDALHRRVTIYARKCPTP
jgi:outer membrane protein OmpA-like peptidoglycan-associated protein